MKRSYWMVSLGACAVLGAASVAVAANGLGRDVAASPSSAAEAPARVVGSVAGYHTAVYPGFVRRMAVVRDGEETVLYLQESPFVLPAGQDTPARTATIEFQGGPAGRDLTIGLEGAIQEIDRIEVVFKTGGDGRSAERLVIHDGPVLCPPMCPTGDGGIVQAEPR